MSKLEDIKYIHSETDEPLSVCIDVYEKNGCNVHAALRELDEKHKSEMLQKRSNEHLYEEDRKRQEDERRSTVRKRVKIVFTVLITVAVAYGFYKVSIQDTPLWAIVLLPIFSILLSIVLAMWLPKKETKTESKSPSVSYSSNNNKEAKPFEDEYDDEYDDDEYDDEDEYEDDLYNDGGARHKTIFEMLLEDDGKDDDRKRDEEEWEESCEECGEYYDDCECDDCGDEDCENW